MAISSNELRFYSSKVVNDTSSNGGRISTNLITSGLSNSWLPNYSESQLASGLTTWRKSFLRIDNATNTVGTNARIHLAAPTAGADFLYLAKGTQTDIQSGTSGLALYGVGKLNSAVIAGATTIPVLVEDPSVTIFRAGDLVKISNQVLTVVNNEVTVTSGTAETKVIATGGVSVSGSVVTLTVTSALAYDYSSTNTHVASIIAEPTVQGATTGKTVTSVAGTFDAAQMEVGNLGSLYQVLTITFTSSTAYTVTSDEVTFASPSGTILSTFAPTNNAVGASYFSIPPDCFGGTFANGDTVVITTIPPCVPIWEKRVLAAGSAAIAAQSRRLVVTVES